MIEITLLNYLKNKLDVPVAMEKPTGNVGEFVLLEKTGTSESNHVKGATFAIQSYSDTLYNAALLNEQVKEALLGNGSTTFGIVAEEDISKCNLNTDYNYTDATTKQYRYQAVFEFIY